MESKFNFKNQESKTQESKESSIRLKVLFITHSLEQNYVPGIMLDFKDTEVTEMQVIVRISEIV